VSACFWRVRGEEAAGCDNAASCTNQFRPPRPNSLITVWFVKQENANTVTCSCLPLTTVIDSKTGHSTLVLHSNEDEK